MNSAIHPVPKIETARLLLRSVEEADLSAYLRLRSSPEVFEYTTGRPLKEEEAWQRFYAALGHWRVRRYGMWIIKEKATGLLIGESGFVDARRDHSPTHKGLPEVGWWMVDGTK